MDKVKKRYKRLEVEIITGYEDIVTDSTTVNKKPSKQAPYETPIVW